VAEEHRAAVLVRRADGVVVFHAEDGRDRFAERVCGRAVRAGKPVKVVTVEPPAEEVGKRGSRACRGGW